MRLIPGLICCCVFTEPLRGHYTGFALLIVQFMCLRKLLLRVRRAAPPYRQITQTAWGLTSRRGPHLAGGASTEPQMRRTYALMRRN